MKQHQPSDTEPRSSAEHRSNISQTRSRMDDTIDALASRLEGRHVLDELLGYIRSRRSGSGNGNAHHVKERAVESAGALTHTVVDTIRRHPLPATLIGAGVGWLIYERVRSEDSDYAREFAVSDEEAAEQGVLFEQRVGAEEFEGEAGPGRSGRTQIPERLSGSTEVLRRRGSGLKQRVKSGFASTKARMSGGSGPLGERAGEGAAMARHKARRAGSRVQRSAAKACRRSREQVDEHPLEAGLIALAGGLLAGLLTPNPRRVDEWAGPAARDLREQAAEQTHEAVERGKHVASVAAQTAREEAEEAGLTPDALKEKAGTVVEETKQAAEDTARAEMDEQGLSPEAFKTKTPPGAGERRSQPASDESWMPESQSNPKNP